MGIPLPHKCLTAIPKGSRDKRPETKKTFFRKVVIWSALHGDMQQPERAGKESRSFLNTMSADIFLGVPFNIASYSLLLIMIAQVTGYKAGRFIHTLGDTHLYRNHVDAFLIQRDRTILPPPIVTLNYEVKSIFDFNYEDIILDNYNPHPAIKAPVAV
jgi:thymidylate synthase